MEPPIRALAVYTLARRPTSKDEERRAPCPLWGPGHLRILRDLAEASPEWCLEPLSPNLTTGER
jgi:hypothetical protein